MSKIKGIAFDKDGTLIDFEPSWSKGLISLIKSIFPNRTDKQQVLAEEIGFNLVFEKFVGGSVFVNGTTDDVINVWKKHFPELITEDIKQKTLSRKVKWHLEIWNQYHCVISRSLCPI